MKTKTGLLVLLFFISLQPNAQSIKQDLCDSCKVLKVNDNTQFPALPFQDYAPDSCFVKTATSAVAGEGAVWIKGTAFANRVVISGTPTDTLELLPPYYTAVKTFPKTENATTITFLSDSRIVKQTVVSLVSQTDLKNIQGDYSILLYGCFQPFQVKGDLNQMHASLISSGNDLNYAMRKAFMHTALSAEFQFDSLDRNESKPINYWISRDQKGALLSTPQFVIGTGDQIYADAGYKFEKNKLDKLDRKAVKNNPALLYVNHPISAWAYGCCDPLPIVSPAYFETHLNKTYTAFNSFSTLDTVFRKFPSLNVWDDHEIRDGWGSHGDEYLSNGELSLSYAPYFSSAKSAFIQHQFLPGGADLDANLSELNQSAEIGHFSVFTLDLRSVRNINDTTVISMEQLKQFSAWSKGLQKGTYAIIVSSIPFFYGNTHWSEKQANKSTKGELMDDIEDSWAFNTAQRDLLLDIIVDMRENGINPIIVSGDVHVGAMSEIWYKPAGAQRDENKVLCYEIITSGLSHESLGEGQSAFLDYSRNIFEIQRRNDVTVQGEAQKVEFYPVSRASFPLLNFGAIEKKGEQYFLNLFVIDKESDKMNVLTEYAMELNYNKTFTEFDNLCHKGPKQRFYNFFHPTGRVFVPETVEYQRQVFLPSK